MIKHIQNQGKRGSRHMLGIRPIHPFPARMSPALAFEKLPSAQRKSLLVVDPMAGSGTTIVVARAMGHRAIGFDTDPLALLIADSWAMDFMASDVLKIGARVLESAWRRLPSIKQKDAYPSACDEETAEFIRYWFDPYNRRQLRAMADSINAEANKKTKKLLWCAFSRLIIAKSAGASLAMDLSHSRPHKVSNKSLFHPASNFERALRTVVSNAPFANRCSGLSDYRIERGDARSLPLDNSCVDLVITSPPYLNAIDYIRCHKFSLVWMGHKIADLRTLRSANIGSEASGKDCKQNSNITEALSAMGDTDKLPPSVLRMLVRYLEDMNCVTREITRILAPSGQCVVVIGDCNIKGVFVRNSEAIMQLGELHGLRTRNIERRPIPDSKRYLPPPSHSQSGTRLQNRMREEVVITLDAS